MTLRLPASDPRVRQAIQGKKPSRRRSVSSVPILVSQIRAFGLPTPEAEVKFHPVRKWRADLLWREPRKLIVEVEGGVFVGGRHSRGLGLEADAVKYAEALCLGYPVLRVTPRHIRQGQAVEWIQRFFREART